MADVFLIHDDIKLYTTDEMFYLEPTINPTEVMVIDRVSGDVSVKAYGTVKIPLPENEYRPVCGFLGTIKLISGYYLVVAKYRILKGTLNGHEIFQLAGHEIIPFAKYTIHLNSKQREDNKNYESLLNAALEAQGIYFSYGYDLTHSLQRLHSVDMNFQKMSMTARADRRFIWNGHLLKDFTHPQFARFALPLIQGFVSINRLVINGHQLTWSLVSRRSVDRPGTRLFMRGIDMQGHVANFVETEQIVERGGEKSSFIQTRGSIPLFWNQYPDLKYKPSMTLAHEDHVAAYLKHMEEQKEKYGSQVLINLVDQHGKEEHLERGYRTVVATTNLPGVRYEPFDFHSECRGMRYDRLSVLLDRVQHEQTEFGYFFSRGGSVLLRQRGVFRTNCVDCLDRTNVLQSLVGDRQLRSVLNMMTIYNDQPLPENVMRICREVWADHADMISVQYSGTGALKTDFTRTGKRTKLGLIRDGINSLTRYYKNNFCDGFRQDSVDLFLGRYVVEDNEGYSSPSRLRREKDWKYVTLPSFLLVAVSMFCASAVLPSQYNSSVLMYLMFWGACVGLTLNYIMQNGKDFVQWPRLDAGGLASTLAEADTRLL